MMNLAAESAFLISPVKPVLVLLVLIPWAWVVGRLDKDAEYYFLKRPLWGLAHIGAGVIGFGALILSPIFWLGLPLALVVLGGEVFGYIFYRNQNVPEGEQWTLDLDSFRRKTESMRQAQADRTASLVLMNKDDVRLPVPVTSDPNHAAHMALATALEFAFPRGADVVELAVDAEKARLTARVDGVRYPMEAIEPATAVRLIDYVKAPAGLDLEERRRKQIGKLQCEHDHFGRHTLEVHTAGSTRGLSMIVHVDPKAQVSIPIDKLGMTALQVEQLKSIIHTKGRVVIVSAPPSQGSTTTLYALLQSHDPYTTVVTTWEDEIAYEVEGVDHNVIDSSLSPEQFNEKLTITLRSEPDVMMLSRLADAKTTNVCARAWEQTRFYLPIAGSDTFSVVKKWAKAVGDTKLAAHSLGGIVAQRLVRKLCPTCRQAYAPDPEALRKLNLSADRVSQFYRSSGKVANEKGQEMPCPTCHGMGYRGRIAVFEVMVLDDSARKLLAANDADRLRAYLRKNKMLWLQEAALAKVVEGVTDIKEVTRAMAEGK